tara:strand:- start:1819 stop:2121 length:303 start_codon:yes stop_codon:yes gene_type:complete
MKNLYYANRSHIKAPDAELDVLAKDYVQAVLGPVNGHGHNVHPVTGDPSQIIMGKGYAVYGGAMFMDAVDQAALELEGEQRDAWFGDDDTFGSIFDGDEL